jgi:hypothetical protein
LAPITGTSDIDTLDHSAFGRIWQQNMDLHRGLLAHKSGDFFDGSVARGGDTALGPIGEPIEGSPFLSAATTMDVP